MPGIFDRTKFPYTALATAVLAATASLGRASPTGGEVVAGDGNITQPDTNTTNIEQHSDKLVIDWQSFDVDIDESVNFSQPSSSALVLNQILNGDVSVIRGQINANGQVILANPNGVYFSSTAQLSVGSLVASGHAISTEDFLNDELNFERVEGTEGAVINHGTIAAATGGSVTLLGSRVENGGYIVAHAGRINLAVGDRIALDFDGDGLMRFSIDEALLSNTTGSASAITNSGELLANGGTIVLEGQVAQDIFSQVVNNEGIIKAGRIDNSGGVISLVGSGGSASSVVNSGRIDASALDADSDGGEVTLHAQDSTLLVQDGSEILANSSGQQGGQVQLLGDQIALTGDVQVDASGELGGGEILIGGDYQGKNSDLPNAEKVVVGSQVNLNADANRLGDGGRIIVWADDWTRFGGTLSARGGAEGGDGGFAEVSGKQNLAFYGLADLSAAFGKFGVLLLDPTNINIVAGTGTEDTELTGDGEVLFADGPGDFQIGATTISNQIADVMLQASNNITQDLGADINITNADTSITLQADNDIELNAGITTNGGNITLQADNDTFGGGTLTVSTSGLTSVGGDINLSGDLLTISGAVDASGGGGAGTVNMAAGGGISLGADVTSGGAQTYSNAVSLTGVSNTYTLQGSQINFGGLVAGNSNGLSINGDLDLDGTLSGVTAFSVSGTSNLAANVSTTGTQTYTGAVTLDGNRTLTGSDINFVSTVAGDGGDDDSLVVTGDLDLDGALSGLTTLSVSGASDLAADVTTSSTQTYDGAVTLAGERVLAGTQINFDDTVTGDTANGLTITGDLDLDGALTDVTSLSVNGASNLAGDITTSSTQTYSGAVTLSADVTLDADDDLITFGNTLDGTHALVVDAGTANSIFTGAVGGATELASLEVVGSASIADNVSTSGTQTYTGDVTLTSSALQTLAGSTVTFSNDLTGNGADNDLTIDGNLDLDGSASAIEDLIVTGTANLEADVNTTGTQTYTDAVNLSGTGLQTLTGTSVHFDSTLTGNGVGNNLTITGNLDLDGSASAIEDLIVNGTANLEADVNTVGTQTYNGTVALSGTALQTLTGTTVNFGSTLTGNGAGNDLTIAGNLDLDGSASAIEDLIVNGTANLEADVNTTGTQTYDGAVTLAGTGLQTLTGTTVHFDSTLTGNGVGNNLTIAGDLDLDGSASAIEDLIVTGTANLEADVNTSGTQTYDGAVTLAGIGLQTLTGTTVNFGSTLTGNGAGNDLTIAGNLDLDGSASAIEDLIVNGTANLEADVNTVGTQTYNGTVALSGTALQTLTGTTVNFGSTLTGNGANNDLTIAGNLDLDGSASAIEDLIVTGTANLEADVNTTGTQTYDGAVNLSGTGLQTLTGTTVNFGSTLTGNGTNNDLTVDGNLDLDGSASAIEDLIVNGTANLAANITTSGTQLYSGAVTLTDSAQLTTTNSAITFSSTINGTHSLTLAAGAGAVSFGGAVGGVDELSSLSVTGSSIALNADVSTSGTQTYNGVATLTGDRILDASSVLFANTLTGDNNNLTVNGDLTLQGATGTLGAVDINGNLDLQGALSNTASLDVSGTTSLGADVTTTGSQLYSSAVTLAADAILNTTDSAITFNSTVNGTHSLTLAAGTGAVSFAGAVGGIDDLTTLTVTGGTIALNADINTTGTQTYTGATTLAGDRILTGSAVDIDGTLTGNGSDLTVNGDLTLQGATGTLDVVDINGDLDLQATAAISNTASLDVFGTSNLAGNVTTTGTQTYSGAATLVGDRVLNGTDISFGDTLTGNGSDLTIDGNLSLNGATGTLAALDIDGNLDAQAAISNTASLEVSGTSNLAANVTTTGAQSYNGAVTLDGVRTLAGTQINFGNTVAGDGNDSLSINGNLDLDGALSGLTTLGVSGTSNLAANVTTSGAQTYTGAVTLQGPRLLTGSLVTFSNDLTGNNADLDIAGSLALNGVASNLADLGVSEDLDLQGSITSTGSLSVDGEATLAGNVTTSGSQTYSGDAALVGDRVLAGSLVTFSDALTGDSNDLTVTGNLALSGATSNLDVLEVNGNLNLTGDITGTTSLDVSGATNLAADITTSGTQLYSGAVTLASGSTLNSGGNAITFGSTLNGEHALIVNAGAGTATFNGEVGGADELTSLNVTGGAIAINADVSTDDAQTYNGATNLTGNRILTGTSVIFNNSLTGNGGNLNVISDDLTLQGATSNLGALSVGGNLDLNGAITNTASLDVTGTSNLAANVTTSGTQSYTGAVDLVGNRILAGTDIGFTSTLTGDGSNLNIDGDLTLGGATGTLGALDIDGNLDAQATINTASLDVSGTSNLAADVTTTGAQIYTGVVTLADDVDLATTNSNITFSNNLTGNNHSLGINVGSGNFSYQQLNDLNNFTLTENAIQLSQNIDTTGSQTYTGNVTLMNDIVLTTDDSDIIFDGTVDGNSVGGESLTLNIDDATATFTGNVGASSSLESLSVSGVTDLGGNVTTVGSQNYQQAVTLSNNATLTTTDDDILFGSTINGANALVLNAGSGEVSFGGIIGGGTALASLEINADAFDLNHNITTTGGQSYNGIVTLTDDIILNANAAVDFSNTINGAHDLTIDAGAGAVNFDQTIGGGTALSGLDVSGSGIDLSGGVFTNGNQEYSGALTLNNDITLSSGGGNITINDTVDGDAVGAQSLTLNSGAGDIQVTGAVGGGNALANLTIVNANDSTFNSTISLAQTFTQQAGSGTTTLNDDVTADTFSFTVSGLTLTNVNLDTSASGGDITLNVDDLLTIGGTTTIDAGAGKVSLAPSTTTNTVHICRDATCVGSFNTTYDLGDLSIDAGTIQFGRIEHENVITLEGISFDYILQVINNANIVVTGNLDGTDDGALELNPGAGNNALLQGGQIHTEDHQTYNSNVLLSGDFSLLSEEGTITINGDLSSATAGNLTLNTNSDGAGGIGNIVFDGSITNLNDLTIVEAQDVNLGGTVDIDGDFDLQNAVGILELVDGLSLTAANIGLNADTITSTGDLELTTLGNGDINLITDTLTIAGDLNMEVGTGTITLAPQDSTSHLELCSGTSCSGTVGDGAEYDIGDGFTFNPEAQFQVGQTNHTGNITLYGFSANYDLALANTGAGAITIDGAFSSTHSLSLSSGSGGITIADDITLQDAALTVDSGTGTITLGAATIDTGSGSQSYTGAIELVGATTLQTDNADIEFTGTINGNQSLDIDTGTGDVDFNDVVGGNVQLASLDVNAGDITFTDISTNGALSLLAQNALNFDPGTTLDAGAAPLTLAINQASGAAMTLDLNGLTLNSTNISLLGSGADRLQGYDNAANDWDVTGSDSGTLASADLSNTAAFDGFSELRAGDSGDTFDISGSYTGNLIGGAGNDTFNRIGSGQVNGQINGGAGSNTYDVSGTSNPVTLVFGQGFSNIQTLIGDGDRLQGSGSVATDWTLNGTDSGTLGVDGDTFTFDGFNYLISGTGGTNIFTSNGQYSGDIELRGNDNRWHYNAGQKLTQGQVLGSGALIIPHRADSSAGDMSVGNTDLSLPTLINYTGNLFIGALITPGTLPLNAAYTDLDINANRLTISDAIQTGGNLILLASEIILTGASISSDKGVSFVAVGDECAVCGGLNGSGNLIVNAETLVEAQNGQVIAAGGVSQSDNLILDFGGGGFELAVSEEQQLTSQPSSLSNAEGITLSANTNAFINRLGLDLVSVAVNFSNPAAAVLGVRAIEVIDLALFEEDLTLFGRMGEGVALAFAQCEEIEGCTPDVTDDELTASIDELQERIDRLEGELNTTSTAERREQIQTLLAGFREQQAEFMTYKTDLQSFTGFEEMMDEELGTDDEIDMEAVERQLAVIETIYTRVRFLENLQFNAERRAHFAETTGLDLTEQRLNEIIESTLAVANRAEAQLEQLLD